MRPPKPVPRPKLDAWRYERDLTCRQLAALINQVAARKGLQVMCSHETARRLCLPFDNAARRVPSDNMLTVISALTDGAIAEADFYPVRTAA